MRKTNFQEKKIKKKEKRVKTKNKVKDKFRGISLFTFMISVSLLPLIVSIAIVSTLSFRITTNNLEQSSREMLSAVSKNLASHCVDVYKRQVLVSTRKI